MKRGLPLLALALTSCTLGEEIIDFEGEPTVDDSPPLLQEVPPPPISGGTLVVLGDERVVASDPDRDRIYVVDIAADLVAHRIELDPGDEPGRIAEGLEGRVHVVLRGSGELASIDLMHGAKVVTRAVCPDPRGVAHQPGDDTLLVTCAGGELLVLPGDPTAGGVAERHFIEPDLRDVAVTADRLYVTRFRSAETLELSPDTFDVLNVRTPSHRPLRRPTAAWRMVSMPDGEVLTLHQYSATQPLPIEPTVFDDIDNRPTPYGGGNAGPDCDVGIVDPAVSLVRTAWTESVSFGGPVPVVDVAVLPEQERMAFASAGARPGQPNLVIVNQMDASGCGTRRLTVPGQVTAVAFTSGGTLLAQSRHPAQITLVAKDGHVIREMELDPSSAFDTGHELFHRATVAAISCAGCHPEGGDDGHVWQFDTLGMRRTQALDVGLEGTAPFHWDGDMEDVQSLADEVFGRRMGGGLQSERRVDAFARFLFSLERPDAAVPGDPQLVSRGAELFDELGCASCHAGAKLTNLASAPIHGVNLQVPSLRRVALRPPYMHDGRAETLRDAIEDMVLATRPDVELGADDLDALEAYLGRL